MFNADIDSDNTYELVCPYCGHEHSDSWEYADGPNSTECHGCEKIFVYETETTRTFSSSQAPCMNGGEHNFRTIKGVEGVYGDFKICRVCDKREEVCLVSVKS